MKLPIPEAAQHVFYDLRPGWTQQVRSGDIVVAGKNFGIGSSRPVARLMRHLGVAALIAEEFNSLFLRNAINNGLPALTIPGVRGVINDGDEITVHLAEGWLTDGHTRLHGLPLPPMVLDILDAGGLLPPADRRRIPAGHRGCGRPNPNRTCACVIMRGGTSKGLYFHEGDLPPAGPDRDALLLRVMGSPDILQIDGLGGSRPITSKVAIITPSRRDDADVDYTFAQVEIDRAVVSYGGNCGNISSGVGPFAVDEGLIEPTEPITRARIFNTNTQAVLVAEVPVHDRRAQVNGDFAIPVYRSRRRDRHELGCHDPREDRSTAAHRQSRRPHHAAVRRHRPRHTL